MPYYPKSQIKINLYTNGNEYIDSISKKPYKGPYYSVSNGNKYIGEFPSLKSPSILLIPTPDTSNPTSGILDPSFIPNSEFNYITPINEVFTPDEDNLYPSSNSSTYKSQNPVNVRNIPQFYTPMLTQQEKDQGYLTRYFCKKGNEYKYIEISKEDFNKLQSRSNDIAWDLYTPLSIKWLIKGNKEEVFKSNKGTVSFEEENKKWYGFSQYLKNNFTKYYLES